MNFDLVNRMPTETLMKLQEMITVVMKARFDTSIRPGRTGTFADTRVGRSGAIITVRVDKVNQRTCSCTEISPNAGLKWKVGMASLKVVPIERAKTLPLPKAVVPHKPTSEVGDSW